MLGVVHLAHAATSEEPSDRVAAPPVPFSQARSAPEDPRRDRRRDGRHEVGGAGSGRERIRPGLEQAGGAKAVRCIGRQRSSTARAGCAWDLHESLLGVIRQTGSRRLHAQGALEVFQLFVHIGRVKIVKEGESSDVILEMMTTGGRRTLKLGPSYRVSGNMSLRAELEHILGPAALPGKAEEPAPAAA